MVIAVLKWFSDVHAIRCHSRDWRLRQLPCGDQGSGRHTRRSTGFNDRWVQRLVAGKVQTNHVSVARLITV